jgi:hypothetical protein
METYEAFGKTWKVTRQYIRLDFRFRKLIQSDDGQAKYENWEVCEEA